MIFFRSYFYSTEHITDDIFIKVIYNNSEYSVSVKFISNIDQNSHEIINVYQDFMKKIIKRLNFGRMKNFYYNKNNVTYINKQLGEIEVWHGFTYGIKKLSSDVLLNLNVSHKIISNESILDWIKSHSDKTPIEINNHLKSMVIVTKYNKNQTYIINSVDFSKTPKSLFNSKYGEITFFDYVSAKYNIQLKDFLQPLVLCKDKQSKNDIYLIPELCFLTGITQEIKQNYNLMKEIASVIKHSSKKKFDECKKLLQSFISSERTKDLCGLYKISISTEPIYISGKRLPAGELLLHKNEIGDREKIIIDDNFEIDRQLQTPLYSQPPLNNWRVLFSLLI
jgi:aubergine-like protein